MTILCAENDVFVETQALPHAQGATYVLRSAAKQATSLPVNQATIKDVVRIIVPSSPAQTTWTLMLAPQEHTRFRKWFVKLQSLTRLRAGWDSYAAPPPSGEAIAAAHSYLSTLELLGWEPTRLEASVMGGVGVTHRQGPRKVYVEFYNDGKVHALFSERTPRMETFPVGSDVPSYYRLIRKAREYLNG